MNNLSAEPPTACNSSSTRATWSRSRSCSRCSATCTACSCARKSSCSRAGSCPAAFHQAAFAARFLARFLVACVSISRLLKLLAAKMLQKTRMRYRCPPLSVVDLLLLQCCCCSCAIARAPVDIRLRGERGQRGRLHVRSEACCLRVRSEACCLRARSGVLHAMRPRAVPDSKGVQS